jgi:type I restriction enzyme S subunit
MRWPQVPLSDLCQDIVVGHVGPSSKHRDSSGIPFLMGKNIGPGCLKLDCLERVSRSFHEREKKSQLRPGDIVVVRIGQSGQAALIPEDFDEANCSGLVVIKRPIENVHAPYLVYYLNSPQGRSASLREAKGSTRSTLNTSSVSKALIPLPPLEEQRRIAAILDKAGHLNRLSTLFDSLKHQAGESLYLSLFGDPIANPYGLPSQKLGEMADCQLGKMLDKKRQHGNSSRPYLRNANVRWFDVSMDDCLYMDIEESEMDRFGVLQGDLLVCEGGEPGRSAIWKGESGVYGFQKALHRIRPKKDIVTPQFLNWSFWILAQRGLLSDHITSATIAHLTREKLLNIDVFLPPVTLQKRFAHCVDKIEAVFAHSAPRHKRLESLRISLFSEFLV